MNYQKANIKNVIQGCLKQNKKAQLQIYERYYKAMFNTAFRLTKNTYDAEDIMQDAFISAFDKLHQLKNAEVFGSWLKRIVVNNCMIALRKQQKLVFTDFNNVESTLELLNENVTEEITCGDKRELLRGLQEIKHSYSTVLSLHFIEGFDYEEIGKIMQINQGNLRTLISRAKVSLRKKMEEING